MGWCMMKSQYFKTSSCFQVKNEDDNDNDNDADDDNDVGDDGDSGSGGDDCEYLWENWSCYWDHP